VRPVVLDSFALLAFFQDEPAAERVERLLDEADGADPLLMSYANLGEVLYISERTRGPGTLERVLGAVGRLPIAFVPLHRRQTIAAARLKAVHPLAYADALCAALAQITGLPVATGDPEFESLEGELKVLWLPRAGS
jgi:PIN domain nuclease of toxin-antitoxin system